MTVSGNTMVSVMNMTEHKITLVDRNTRSRYIFGPQQAKSLAASDIRSLAYVPGILTMFYDGKLRLDNDKLAAEFNIPTDIPEYSYTIEDIDNILLNEDIEVLLDTLDFAPEGILEIVKSRAVALKIPSLEKRKVISDRLSTDKLKVSIDKMIREAEEMEEALPVAEEKTVEKKRRRAPVNKK